MTKKIGEWKAQKHIDNDGFGGTGEWEDGSKITFDNCSQKQIKHCSTEQLLSIESGEEVKLQKTGEWGNETYFDIIKH